MTVLSYDRDGPGCFLIGTTAIPLVAKVILSTLAIAIVVKARKEIFSQDDNTKMTSYSAENVKTAIVCIMSAVMSVIFTAAIANDHYYCDCYMHGFDMFDIDCAIPAILIIYAIAGILYSGGVLVYGALVCNKTTRFAILAVLDWIAILLMLLFIDNPDHIRLCSVYITLIGKLIFSTWTVMVGMTARKEALLRDGYTEI